MIEAAKEYKQIRFVPFKDLLLWDVKRMMRKSISSDFPIVKLGTVITEQNNREKIFEKPNEDFKILGVNNKVGLFDAYIEKGKNINQPYKKVEEGWLAFNPYRINVGSIGIKLSQHKFDYISPAYIVFSCKKELHPEFLFLLFKTETFNTIIRQNTIGAVRQILSFDILSTLQIPLPSYKKQVELVASYHHHIKLSEQQENEAKKIEENIDSHFIESLGLHEFIYKEFEKGLRFINYKELFKWDIFAKEKILIESLRKSKYELCKLGSIYNFVNRSWNKRIHSEKTFNYVEIGSVDSYNGITTSENIEVHKAPSRASQIIHTDDLIISTTRPYLKKFALVSKEYNNCICSSGFSVIEKNERYNLSFLKQFLLSQFGIEQLKNKMTGALYPAITESELKNVFIPLPVVEIQKQIISQLEYLKQKSKSLQSQAEQNKIYALHEFENSIFNN